MEPRFEKLMAQFALLFVVVWVIAAAMGKKSQASLTQPPKNRPGGSNAYRGQWSCYGSMFPQKYYNPQPTADGASIGMQL